jgi:hypothetical protein
MWGWCMQRRGSRRWFQGKRQKAHGHGKHRVSQPLHLKRPFDTPRPLLMNYRTLMLRRADSGPVKCVTWHGKARSLSEGREGKKAKTCEFLASLFQPYGPRSSPENMLQDENSITAVVCNMQLSAQHRSSGHQGLRAQRGQADSSGSSHFSTRRCAFKFLLCGIWLAFSCALRGRELVSVI